MAAAHTYALTGSPLVDLPIRGVTDDGDARVEPKSTYKFARSCSDQSRHLHASRSPRAWPMACAILLFYMNFFHLGGIGIHLIRMTATSAEEGK
jgi:hypothetical protein